MDWKLELVVVPVSDVDRAKSFYTDTIGFKEDVDYRAGDFRVVQLTPPGSACSITLMRNTEAPGSLQGLHLVVSDIDAARRELTGRGPSLARSFTSNPAVRCRGPIPNAVTTAPSSRSATLTATDGWCRRWGGRPSRRADRTSAGCHSSDVEKDEDGAAGPGGTS